MTTSNPFTARLKELAEQGQGGYLPRSSRIYPTKRKATPAPAVAPAFLPADPPLTPRQQELIRSLLSERDLNREARPKYQARLLQLAAQSEELAKLTRDQATALIDTLFALPKIERKHAQEVPEGRYAVQPAEGQLRFYKVDRPTEGRWAGYTFITRQESDEYQRVSRGEQAQALRLIVEQGIKECALRYGHELGVCGVCGRTLTNEESRAAGIGPKCRAGAGW